MHISSFVLAAALGLVPGAAADLHSATLQPFYTSESIVHAATNKPGPFAPNAIVTIYGTDLSWNTGTLEKLAAGSRVPTVLPNTGVRVMVGGIWAPLLYVSPTQVNFVAPAVLRPGTLELRLVRDSTYGPAVAFRVIDAAPGLFELQGWALAADAAGQLIDTGHPAAPGQAVVLYGAGFGQTNPLLSDGLIPAAAAAVPAGVPVQVLLNGEDVTRRMFYIGATPGFAGLYQVNLMLPDELAPNPEIVIGVAGVQSQAGVRLAVRSPPSSVQPASDHSR